MVGYFQFSSFKNQSHPFMLKGKSHRVCREHERNSIFYQQTGCDDPLQGLDHDISVGTQSEQKQMLLLGSTARVT